MPDVPGTVNFPASLDSATSLIDAANNAATTLTVAISNSATTLAVASTVDFPASGAISIEDEIIFYTGITSNSFTGCGRGQDGTSAAAHASGTAVQGLIVAAHHTTLANAVIALETKLGSGASTPSSGKTLRATGTGTSEWTDKITVLSDGKVGIGTTSPTQKLEVAGTVEISGGGQFRLNGGTRMTSTGLFVAANGSATDPAYVFSSDINSGLYKPATSTLGISTASVERIRIDSSGRIGIGTTSPNSILHVAGPIATAIATKTAAYTIGAGDSVILGNATAGAFTVTLPTAVGIAGRQYIIKKIDSSANAVTLDGAGSETIDGAATVALSAQWARSTVVSDGANWLLI